MAKNDNDFRMTFHIRYTELKYTLTRSIKKRWTKFLEKGHEKMTVMFIPHNEKKIFNFQISKFILVFFLTLFMIGIVTSGYAFIKNRAVKREEQRLLMSYNDIRSHLLRFEKMTNSIAGDVKTLKPEIEELYETTTGRSGDNRIWSLQTVDSGLHENGEETEIVMPREVYVLKELQRDIISATNTIKTVRNFIDVRSSVVQDTPSIVPNQGHITSLFGWRRSPFGHGRDFHTGIDIAAAGGTPIYATAPGQVVTAGWGGGYGYMVRIRHRYGYETIHGHMQRVAVRAGQQVERGTRIGYVGMTGNATGNHNHYEIRLGEVPINPYPYMSRVW